MSILLNTLALLLTFSQCNKWLRNVYTYVYIYIYVISSWNSNPIMPHGPSLSNNKLHIKTPSFSNNNIISLSNILCMLTVPSTSVYESINLQRWNSLICLKTGFVTSEWAVLCCWDETCHGCCRKMLQYLYCIFLESPCRLTHPLAHWIGMLQNQTSSETSPDEVVSPLSKISVKLDHFP